MSSDHAHIGWQEKGAGKAIVFLHPIISTSDFWLPQLNDLSDRFRCIALDAPGYRQSAPVGEPVAESTTRQLMALLDHLDIESAHLVGLSLGGIQAQHAALDHPDRFDRVVLADTSAAFGGDADEWLAHWLAPLDQGASVTELAINAIDAIVERPLDPPHRTLLHRSAEDIPRSAFEQASRVIATHNMAGEVSALEHRCLVVVGEHDNETPVGHSEVLAATIPNAALHVIAGAGHLSSYEAPRSFNQAVRNFLSPGERLHSNAMESQE